MPKTTYKPQKEKIRVGSEQHIALGEQKGYILRDGNRVKYRATGKSYNFSDPEEKVRANTYIELIEKYKYSERRIDTEVLGPRRVPKLPADIVVYEDDDKESAFIVVEAKARSSRKDIEEAKREGLGNANLLNSKYLLVVAGSERMVYDIEKHPSTVNKLEKYRVADIPVKYGKVPEYRYKKGNKNNDLRRAEFNELDNKFQLCHDEIWEGGKRDPAVAFDEISKLIITKLYDERLTPHGNRYSFQIGTYEKQGDVALRVRKVYEAVQKKNSDVFKNKITLPDNVVFRIVEHLQDISLRATDLDAKGRAFENFLGKLFRGEYGQYFTARQLVEFMVAVADPDEFDCLIDPACGSGGFLLYSMKHVSSKISNKYKEDRESISRLSWDFSHKQIFGIEINDRIARVAMMDMVIHEDGHSNIECNDALEDYDKFDPKKGVQPNKYDILLTNPPFGKRVKPTEKLYFKNYTLARNKKGKLSKSEMSEILFIERCIDLVREGGFIGIVLPDSAFTNKKNIPVVEYILRKTKVLGVVSLPQHTFVPFGSMAKTSLLFLQKRTSGKGEDYPIFMAHVEHVGYDATRRNDRNDLPSVLKEWVKYKDNRKKYPAFTQLRDDLWITKINLSQLTNKLDVEAYGKGYIETLEKIEKTKDKGKTTKVVPLGDVCLEIFAGVGPSKADYKDVGIPIVKTGTVSKITNQVGFVNWPTIQFVNEQKYKNSKKFLQQNDILIQSVAHSKAYIADKMTMLDKVPKGYDKILALSKFIIIRPNPKEIDPTYLLVYLSSSFGREQFKHFIRGMTAEIYKFDIRNVLVVVPSTDKQKALAKKYMEGTREFFELEELLASAKDRLDAIEQEI